MQDASQNEQSVANAFALLEQWKRIEQVDEIQPLGNASVYKTSDVVCVMIYQQLGSNHSLKDAVEFFFRNAPISESSNRRLRESTLSTKTGTYSAARKRVTVDFVDWLQSRVSQSIIESTTLSFKSRRVFLIDGTTLSAAPTPELQKEFPPASNQHGEGVWPINYLVTAHELSSGAAMTPEIGSMYGPNAVGETRLAESLIARLPEESIVLADAAYGI